MFIYHLFSSIILVFDMKNIFLYHTFPSIFNVYCIIFIQYV